MIKAVKIPPLGSVEVRGITKIKGQLKCIHMIVEPPNISYSDQVVTTSMYTELKPGSYRIGVCLRNLSAKEATVPAQTLV